MTALNAIKKEEKTDHSVFSPDIAGENVKCTATENNLEVSYRNKDAVTT